MMNLDLFVDTSRKGISMALSQTRGESQKNFYVETIDESARGETASAILDELLTRVGARLEDIKRVLVTVGPGSFSGLRTGVAFCQGLCFSGKRELYGVSSLHALECFADADSTEIAVVTKARPGFWYFRQTSSGIPEESFIETAMVLEHLKKTPAKYAVVDDAAEADESLRSFFAEAGLTVIKDTGKPLSCWSKLFNVVKPSLIQEANYIQPSYFEKLK